MARPNRVYFLSNYYTHIKDTTITDELTYLDIFVKAMSSGFGPYPVVSIEVIDGVATLTLDQEVLMHPGIKLDINGTGVTDLDGFQEVDSIDGNTLTFLVDVPDGSYSNGLEFSYPSLGWELLERDSKKALFRSGNSGNSSNHVLVEMNYKKKAEPAYCNGLTIRKVEASESIKDFRQPFPSSEGISIPIYTYLDANQSIEWFFYGDDCFCHLGYVNYYILYTGTYSSKTYFNTLTFGELKKSKFTLGSFIACGTMYQYYDATYNSSNYSFDALKYGQSKANVANLFDNFIFVSNAITDRNNFTSQATILNTIKTSSLISGPSNLNKANSRSFLSNFYVDPIVVDDVGNYCGSIPGIYFIAKPGLERNEKPELQILRPATATGKLEGRKLYTMYGTNINTGFVYTGSFSTDSQSTCLIDLTGPIR